MFTKTDNNSDVSYRISETDEIIFLNDAWTAFALANGAPELIAEKVLNRNLWDFISDDTTRDVYRQLVDKVRGNRFISFDFRCDSPDLHRFLEMKITLREDKNVQFDTRLISAEKRVYQNAFQKGARRGNGVIIVCSWCKKIDTRDGNWREIEEAVTNLEIFESENIPQLSHGMCVPCYQTITAKHQNTSAVETVMI
jgi:hypothetical protein